MDVSSGVCRPIIAFSGYTSLIHFGETPRRKKATIMAENQTTIQNLESHLWEAANILRGSPVDRTDWKSYILPLLFFKRICDVRDEESRAMVATYGEDFADEHRFQIPAGCHWRDVRETATDVGTALQNALRGAEKQLREVMQTGGWLDK